MDNQQIDTSELDSVRVPQEEELRTKIISDFGFDELADAEKIDKLVEREMEHHRKMSQLIGQKIKHRQGEEELAKKLADKTNPSVFSTKDVVTLAKAEIDVEDLEEVENYAKYRGISIAEAVGDSTLKMILASRKEQRTSANAAQTKGPRMASRVTGETLLEAALQGRIPEKDEDIERMVEARIERAKKSHLPK